MNYDQEAILERTFHIQVDESNRPVSQLFQHWRRCFAASMRRGEQFQYNLMQKYQIIEKIGEGAYGVVLKCKCNDPEITKRKNSNHSRYVDIVAMKQFKDSDQNQIVKRTTMREVKVLKMLSHPNIVQLKQAFRKRGFVYLIFEYVRHNLLEVLQKSPDGLDHELIRIFIYQLIKGLAYLHSLNIIHRDIKPENLLISEENELKICDFGFARVYKKSTKDDLTDYVATRWYRSPELLVGTQYNKEIDMWAVGCIMGELIDGNPMFPGENELDQLFLIQKCLGPLAPEHYQTFLKNPRFVGTKFPEINNLQTIDKRYSGKFSPKGLNLLKGMLKLNPADRMTAHQALSHPYFEGVEQEQILRRQSGIIYLRNESKMTEKDQTHSPTVANTSTNETKKNSNPIHQSTVYYDLERDKTELAHHHGAANDNIFKVQKLNIGKKKKEDNFMTSKGMSNYSSTNSSNTSNIASKSLGKAKVSTKLPTKESVPRHISLEKATKRETLTKTQTGFYIVGGSIIPQRLDEDQESAHYIQPEHFNNKIYNIRSPKSRNNFRKQTNLNTEEILEEEAEAMEHSAGQLPFLAMASHKSSENRHHKTNYNAVPNIIITNSTFNYRHH